MCFSPSSSRGAIVPKGSKLNLAALHPKRHLMNEAAVAARHAMREELRLYPLTVFYGQIRLPLRLLGLSIRLHRGLVFSGVKLNHWQPPWPFTSGHSMQYPWV
jgi:hypothetical protein